MHTWTSPQDASYEAGVTEVCKCKAKWPSIFSMPGMPIHHPWAGNAPFQCRELDARVVATLTPHMANEGQPPASGKSSAPSRGSATMPSKTGEGGISNASGAGVVVASLGRGFELVPG
ncbi:hypothetical protein Purlil1_10596 [Purpureocillium lilacinum]|uniref:Uncharacterized protein n=1 Tax=Purpureocillium lilacinum TaxID=33203 RepID=A0ABR0BM35_PURLI|nr:hypothetical protein Purlil1_10596 [Purpureocillium lilacinum]